MKSKRKCRHIETGDVYDSVKELAESLDTSIHKIHHILGGRVKDSIGVEYIGESLVGTVVKEAKCIKCNIVKPRKDFGIDKRTNGIRGYTCKKCRCERESSRRVSLGKEEMRIRSIKNTYKVSRYEAERLYNTNNCDICNIQLTSRLDSNISSSNRNIDHCHNTGEVRGVLCAGCNLAIGHAKEDVNTLNNMIKYLTNKL